MTAGISQEVAEAATILRCEAGSSVFGLNLDDQGDRDELGVCLEAELKDAIDASPLAEDPDRDAVNEWLVGEYLAAWA